MVLGRGCIALGTAYTGFAVAAIGGFTRCTGGFILFAFVIAGGRGGGAAAGGGGRVVVGRGIGGMGDWMGGGCGISAIGKEEEVTKFIPFIPEFMLMSLISIGRPALPMSMVLMAMFGSPFEVALGGAI